MRTVMQVSVITLTVIALLACFAVAQDATPKPKVSAVAPVPLPVPAAPQPAPQVAPKPAAAPQVPPLGNFILIPPQYFLDAYSTHPYQEIQVSWRDYVIREQSRAIVELQKRVAALEQAGQTYGGGEPNQLKE